MDLTIETPLSVEFFDLFQTVMKWTTIDTIFYWSVITTPATLDDEERHALTAEMMQKLDRFKVVMATLEVQMLKRTGRDLFAHTDLRPLTQQAWAWESPEPETSSCIARHPVAIAKFVLTAYLEAKARRRLAADGAFLLDLGALAAVLNDGGYAGQLTWCTPAVALGLLVELKGLLLERVEPTPEGQALVAVLHQPAQLSLTC